MGKRHTYTWFPEKKVMNKLWLLLLLPLAFVLGWVKPAQAGDITPVENRDYWIMPSCDVGTCIKIAPDININTPLFAAKLKTTPIDIRRDNPMGTIALCHRPGDGYRMGTINKPADRADDSVWASCPNPADQYVYVLPGQIIRLTGVKHLSFSEQQKILSDTMACETQACLDENNRKLNSKVKRADKIPPSATVPPAPPPAPPQASPLPSSSATAQTATPGGSSAQTTVVVSEVPAWAWKLIIVLFSLTVGHAVLYYRLRFFSLERILLRRLLEAKKEFDEIVQGMKEKAKAEAKVLADRDGEVRQLTSGKLGLQATLDRLRTSLTDFAKRESVPLPQGTSDESVCMLVTQRFLEIARDNGELKNAKLLAEKNCAEALGNLEKQVEINSQMAVRVTEQNSELEKLRSSRDDDRKNRDRLAELHGSLEPLDRELVLVDNELTSLVEPHQSLIQEHQALEAAGDSQASLVKAEIVSIESRILPLHNRRQALIAEADALREEFNILFVQLNGFGLNEVPLYEEAQRDRNDAAKELGKAKAIFILAEAQRENDKVRFEEREQAIEAKVDELVARECAVTDRERLVSKRIEAAQNYELQLKQREDRVAAFESSVPGGSPSIVTELVNAKQELLKQRESIGNLSNELADARENSRRFKSELEKRTAELEAAEKSHAGCAEEISDLKSQVEDLTSQLEAADLKVAALGEDLDALRLGAAKTPSPVPSFPINAPTPPHRPTIPYNAASGRQPSACESFFGSLIALLSEPAPMVVDTAQKAWALYDFLNASRIDIRLNAIFPGGPPSNYSVATWDRQCEKFRSTAVEKVSYVIEELSLEPPQGYKPLALAIGS
ncbi:MAG: hypothetical protein WC551_07025 [Patescibacteria group bacterium]